MAQLCQCHPDFTRQKNGDIEPSMLLALLLAAMPPSSVIVAPADPMALFKSDAGQLEFYPDCNGHTLDTVQSSPTCAARLAKGEVTPSLTISAMTLQSAPARSGEVISLLQRSAAATDNPAVYYLLGSILGTAEKVQPNYPLAMRYLAIAADRGNPAAADLLANLLIAGKGAPRDVPRAVRLYEKAAANGFPIAAVSLGKHYLAGKVMPKDEVLGLAWLDAAAAVNAPAAAQLAAMARSQDKINNFQLIPSADPAGVKAVRYGTFDNPDIPPNFGFDPAFQAIHDAPYDDPVTLARLETDAANLPTPYLYELARRLAARDAPRSLKMYLLARTRMTYDASRCADPASLGSLRAWDMLVAADLRFLFAGGKLSPTIVNDALAEESNLPADTTPWWVCRSGMSEMTAAMNGKAGPLRLKPASEWPELRKAARAQLARLAGNP